jgi:hypothetical protein
MRQRLAALLGLTIAFAAGIVGVASASETACTINKTCLASSQLLTSALASGVVWSGDGISASLPEQWAAISDQEHCSQITSASNMPDGLVKMVSDTRFSQGRSINFHMNAGDHSCYSGRSELGQGNPYSSSNSLTAPKDRRFTPGMNVWIAWQAIFPKDYPLNSPVEGGGGMIQIHVAGNGKSPYGLGVGRGNGFGAKSVHEGGSELGYLELFIANANGSFEELNIYKNIHAERVYRFLTHYVVAESATGSVQQYVGEGTTGPLTKVFERANYSTYHQGPDFLTAGMYPDTARPSSSPAYDLRMSGFNVSTTQATAESTAGWLEAPKEEPPVEEPPKEEEHKEVKEVAAVPHTPTGLSAVSHSTSISLAYNANPTADAVTQYNVYRAGVNYPGHTVSEPWGTSKTLTFSNSYSVAAGMWICYQISAVNAKGASPKTAPACVVA